MAGRTMSSVGSIIDRNVSEVRGRIAEVAVRAGRSPRDVRLVAVTKRAGVAECEALIALGATDLGENYPQELWRKAAALADSPVRWHLIGHLQRNKARRTLPIVETIHSVDRLDVITLLDRLAMELDRSTQLFLEVNTS